MILRLTFNDNDFTELLQKFITNGYLSYSRMRFFVKESMPDKLKEFDDYFNEKAFHKISNTGRKFYESLVKSLFIEFIKDKSYDSDTINYLINELKISITNQYRNKWENGEVVYYMVYNGNQYIIN